MFGPLETSHGNLNGPPSVAPIWTLPYDGSGWPVSRNENGRAFHAELPRTAVSPPEYNERPRGRPLPNARDCANGDAAPLFVLPLIMSAASGGGSSAATATVGAGDDTAGFDPLTISAYDCIASVTAIGSVIGDVTSRVTVTNPRISMRMVQTPSASAANRNPPVSSDVVMTVCSPRVTVTAAPGTPAPANSTRPATLATTV